MYLIVTASFNERNKVQEAGFFPISISLTHPKGLKYIQKYPPLNPTWDMIQRYKAYRNEEEYTQKYNEILYKIGAVKIMSDLVFLSGGDAVALLCWEKPGDFCHRRLVAKFLEDNIEEITVPEFSTIHT